MSHGYGSLDRRSGRFRRNSQVRLRKLWQKYNGNYRPT